MSSLHLKDFAKQRGQPEAALLLGLTQGALSKAIRVGRHIMVTQDADGNFSAEERRPFPSRSEPRDGSVSRPALVANVPLELHVEQSPKDAGFLSSTTQASP